MNETRLGKYRILYPDSREYHSLKKEIWTNDIYYFKSGNEKPFIIDIGSHIGISVLYFKSIYPNSKILAFEPNPTSFEILEENISTNGIEDVTVVNKGIWKEKGIKDLHIAGWSSNSAFMSGSWTGKEKTEKIAVNTTTLHEYIDGNVQMLKIDTEGSELSILKAHRDILNKIENICIEYHPIKGTRPEDILNILKPLFSIEIYHEGKLLKNIEKGKLLTIKGKKLVKN